MLKKAEKLRKNDIKKDGVKKVEKIIRMQVTFGNEGIYIHELSKKT